MESSVPERETPNPGDRPDRERDRDDTPETPPTEPPPVPVEEPPSQPGANGPYVTAGAAGRRD